MAGFSAIRNVSKMSFDFRPFATGDGSAGDIPEPTTDQLAEFYLAWEEMIRANRDALVAFDLEPTDGKEPTRDEIIARDRKIAEFNREHAAERVEQRITLIAAVCSQMPSEETLRKLPSRILDAFETYVFEEFAPKASKDASSQ